MSFSAQVKEELCRVNPGHKGCYQALCYGVLLYCNTFSGREIKIMTENRSFAQALPRLFKRAFALNFDEVPADMDRPGKLIFRITDPEKTEQIFQTYGYSAKTPVHHINLGVLENECCRRSFMRGAFLAGGSVTDPARQYHLELVTDHYNVRGETYALLQELGFSPKQTDRSGNYITYFKQSDAISDFLTAIGAAVSAMEVISARIEKDMRNSVNRKVNCDTANVTKTVEAAMEQTEAIRKLEQAGLLEGLPEKLRQTAQMRMDNPEMSLSELASALDPPVTKSCLNHRLRKLMALAESL